MFRRTTLTLGIGAVYLISTAALFAQVKPNRVVPPKFDESDWSGIFFKSLQNELVGTPPRLGKPVDSLASGSPVRESGPSVRTPDATSASELNGDSQGRLWSKVISGLSIEDVVKGTKLRLDQTITSPAKYASGGYDEARLQFALLAASFAIIENYDGSVRWQSTAKDARQLFTRAAENARSGSAASFEYAKARKENLQDILRGMSVSSGMPDEPFAWPDVMDRDTMMRLLEWSLREQLANQLVDEKTMQQEPEAALRYSELIHALGVIAVQPDMIDADDEDYVAFAEQMNEQAFAVSDAIRNNRWESASDGLRSIDQACSACHEMYR